MCVYLHVGAYRLWFYPRRPYKERMHTVTIKHILYKKGGIHTMAVMTEEQKLQRQMELDMLTKMQEQFNGCPLFEGREKGSLDDVEGEELTIEQIYPLQDYHCVVFREKPDNFYLTGGALKDLCNEYEPQFVINRVIVLQPKVKTKARRDFRPIKVIR